jgi:hypothetical protein
MSSSRLEGRSLAIGRPVSALRNTPNDEGLRGFQWQQGAISATATEPSTIR